MEGSLSLIYLSVVVCDEMFWDVLRWCQRVIFRSLLVPSDNIASVLSIAFMSYDVFSAYSEGDAGLYLHCLTFFVFLLLRLVSFFLR